MILTKDQTNILQEGKIEGNKFFLQGQLDRKQYQNINEVLNTIGLIWNRKEKAHIADSFSEEDLKNSIEDIVETGEVETLKETIKKFQFYHTPKEVAEYLVELAEIKEDDFVLEPSAGQGSILMEFPKYKHVTAIEIKDDNFNVLKEKFGQTKICLIHGNFLEYGLDDVYEFDKIIANPPFSKSQDVKHILHMYELLQEGGRLVSIASASILTRTGKLYDELRKLSPECLELPKGSFKESGTMVNTIILIINK